MTPLTTLWLTSIAGALLFLGAGFLAGCFRARPPEGSASNRPTPSTTPDLGELQQLRFQLDAITRERDEARSARRGLAADLASLKQSREQATAPDPHPERDRAKLQGEVARLQSDVEQARTMQLAAEREARQAAREVEELRKQGARSEEHVMEIERLRQQAGEIEALREERSRVNAALRESEQALSELRRDAGEARSLAAESGELKIRLKMLSGQLEKLELLRDENARLRQSSTRAVALEQELEQLRAENSGLRARNLVQQQPGAPSPAPLQPRPGALGGSLQSVLDRLGRDPRARAAVVSDHGGLLVAGSGEQAEPLAAAAAILFDVGLRLQQILTLGPVQLLTCLDENGLVFATLPFSTPPDDLLLATLTVGADGVPERPALERMLAEL